MLLLDEDRTKEIIKDYLVNVFTVYSNVGSWYASVHAEKYLEEIMTDLKESSREVISVTYKENDGIS
jgi:hypothetical protein